MKEQPSGYLNTVHQVRATASRSRDPKATKLGHDWIAGRLTDNATFNAIETLAHEVVPDDSGDEISMECYARTLLRSGQLMALQQAVLMCMASSHHTEKSRAAELELMNRAIDEGGTKGHRPSMGDRHLDAVEENWINGRTSTSEVLENTHMFVDGVFSSALVKGLSIADMRESYQVTLRHGLRAATLQFAAQKAEQVKAETSNERRRIIDQLRLQSYGECRSR